MTDEPATTTEADDQTDDEICEIVITAPDPEWLAAFTRRLVEDHLAASGHIIEQIRTIYRWEGEVHDTHEGRVALRTRRSLAEAILARVKAEHPYRVPSVISLSATGVNPEYGRWINTATASPPLGS
jgi:periplasmic divalent cation tolerance protein